MKDRIKSNKTMEQKGNECYFPLLNRRSFRIAVLGMIITLWCSCEAGKELKDPWTISHQICLVPDLITNEAGFQKEVGQAQIFELPATFPITNPFQQEISIEQFKSVRGKIDLAIADNGFFMKLELSKLIPHGVYTLRMKALDKYRQRPPAMGFLGRRDGTQSSFVAGEDGTAVIEVFTPIESLLLSDVDDFTKVLDRSDLFVVGAYHLDNRPSGSGLLADSGAVEQFGFALENP